MLALPSDEEAESEDGRDDAAHWTVEEHGGVGHADGQHEVDVGFCPERQMRENGAAGGRIQMASLRARHEAPQPTDGDGGEERDEKPRHWDADAQRPRYILHRNHRPRLHTPHTPHTHTHTPFQTKPH